MGNRRENKAAGAAKFNTDPVERRQKKPGSCEQNQDGEHHRSQVKRKNFRKEGVVGQAQGC